MMAAKIAAVAVDLVNPERVSDAIHLTFQQQWLWRLLQSQPDWRCVVAYTYRLKGPLNSTLLQKSLEVITSRHDALRTRVLIDAGTPMLRVEDTGNSAFELVTIPGDRKAQTEANARRWIEAFCARTVDPILGPLLSVRLLELDEDEHWLMLAMHRLMGDCASIDQVFREVWLTYGSLLRHQEPSTAIPTPQYPAYAARQQQTDQDWHSRHGGYWRERLMGAQSIGWPTDPSRSSVSRGTLGRMSIRFGVELSTELRGLARQSRTLYANVILAVYVTVLWRRCGQSDFVLPFFVAGRQSEHKAVVGYLSHILYLRVRVTGAETFRQLLSQIGNELFRAFSHQDFGRMSLQHPHLLEGAFFQWVTWHGDEGPVSPSPDAPDTAAGVTAERITLSDFAEDITAMPPGMVAVELSVFDTLGGIYASGVYRADLFSPDTMDGFVAELRDVASRCVREPDTGIAALGSEGS